ncbi:group II intron maturase-specific domain-containing protein [Streptomyces lancefieldiae]|uniref:Group II intron maturase-specific domain-containing protein n=1 Tax=Streptomyces lancefieldiae TaxID=3075520 RepID=A0ABU3B0Q8_9ACTN|nr:group II intron maturase-specific domain-containing protein [Streptomyces sp. DSM 40712]MDT0615705.1 group II intron maturase-specific domain-containing protein [Streptomyces sp. DSM 40712]
MSDCGCILTRPGSCTARTASGAAPTNTRRSPSSGSPSEPAGRGTETVRTSPASYPRSARTPRRRSTRRSARGGSTGRSTSPSSDLARRTNPIGRGWMQYYGAFYRSALHPRPSASTPT